MSRTALASGAALVLALASIGLNVHLLSRLRHPERLARDAVAAAADGAAGADATLRFPVRVPAGIPLRLDVPIDERVLVRIDTVLAVRTQAVLPIRSPLGSYDVRVPVRADVPIRMTVPVHIRQTVRISARTPEEIVIPLELRLQDLPFDSLLKRLPER